MNVELLSFKASQLQACKTDGSQLAFNSTGLILGELAIAYNL
ncbi:MAG: hypothetical protein PVG26_10640 [Desulfobacterales bacterium]|jgi:hypothetical protein